MEYAPSVLRKHPELMIGVTVADEVLPAQLRLMFPPRTFPVHDLVFLPFVGCLSTDVLELVGDRWSQCLVRLCLHQETGDDDDDDGNNGCDADRGGGNVIDVDGGKKEEGGVEVSDPIVVVASPPKSADETFEEGLLALVRRCRRLTHLTLAFRFHLEFASQLLASKGKR